MWLTGMWNIRMHGSEENKGKKVIMGKFLLGRFCCEVLTPGSRQIIS